MISRPSFSCILLLESVYTKILPWHHFARASKWVNDATSLISIVYRFVFFPCLFQASSCTQIQFPVPWWNLGRYGSGSLNSRTAQFWKFTTIYPTTICKKTNFVGYAILVAGSVSAEPLNGDLAQVILSSCIWSRQPRCSFVFIATN